VQGFSPAVLYSSRDLQFKIHPVRNILKLAVQFPLQDQGYRILLWLLASTAKNHRQRWPWAMQTGSLPEGKHPSCTSSRQRQRKLTGGEQSFNIAATTSFLSIADRNILSLRPG
jgi:hypothetical protein